MPHFIWNGKNIAYREMGQGELLFILPGNTASSICHQHELEYFSDRYHVVSVDFLGTGQSDRVAVWDEDWWKEGADQVHALMEHLGYEECLVMGTSGGAAAALLMAIHHPQAVKAVIADSCGQFFSKAFADEKIIADRAQRLQGQVQFWSYAHGEDWEQVVDADTDMIMRFVESGGDWFGDGLSSIQCPVLLTASKQDQDIEHIVDQNCAMAKQIKNCRLFINDHGSHPFMWSDPGPFRNVTDLFLADFARI